jgi:hypothetical protein
LFQKGTVGAWEGSPSNPPKSWSHQRQRHWERCFDHQRRIFSGPLSTTDQVVSHVARIPRAEEVAADEPKRSFDAGLQVQLDSKDIDLAAAVDLLRETPSI